jgi:crossover junction endodeoxyribonuclease RuvC
MKVLGIDPSVQSTGFGIIEYAADSYSVLAFGAIKPSRQLLFHQKINLIRNRLDEIIRIHRPDDVAIENPFYAQNVKTAITLGQVRGAALVAVASHNCPLYEYSPLGNDAADALAAALCHLNTRKFKQNLEGHGEMRGKK